MTALLSLASAILWLSVTLIIWFEGQTHVPSRILKKLWK